MEEKNKNFVCKEVNNRVQRTFRELELFYAAIKMCPDGIIIGDAEGYITEVNDGLLKMYSDCDRSVFVGKHVVEFLVEEDRERAVHDSLDTLKSGQGKTSEYRVLSKNGKELPVEVTVALIKDEDEKIIGFVDIVRNISNRKKIEAELRQNNQKIELMNEKLRIVGGLTRHDIFNKLQIINSYVFLANKKGNYEQALNSIKGASEQINKLLEFSKDFEMIGSEELRNVDVDASFYEAVGLVSDLKGIRVINECTGLTVLADSLLRQLFYNLLDNTLKYGENTTQIRVSYKESNGQLSLVYEDNGVGIASGDKAKIFNRSFGKGTGLGLYLIAKIMEVYGWQIEEIGVEGEGAKFVFTIPEKNAEGKRNYKIRNSWIANGNKES
jgi:PAS domain S-box-containing protein